MSFWVAGKHLALSRYFTCSEMFALQRCSLPFYPSTFVLLRRRAVAVSALGLSLHSLFFFDEVDQRVC